MRRYVIIAISAVLFFVTITIPLREIYSPHRYRELLKYYAGKYDLDWLLISAIVFHESSFRHKATSNKGARGLMQIMPDTGYEIAKKIGIKDFSLDNLYRPIVNLEFGCFYFGNMMKEFNNDVKLSLAGYNAGKGAVYRCFGLYKKRMLLLSGEVQYDKIKGFLYPETRKYVNRISFTYGMLKILNSMWPL